MKKMLFLTAVIMLCAGMAFAQPGFIGIFADPGGTSCNLVDLVPGLTPYYIVHVWTPGATASQFAAPMPPCMVGAIWLSDTPVYPVTIGNSQIGVAIGYGACIPGPNHILTINYFVNGLTPPCCYYYVVEDPNVPSGEIEIVDCTSTLWLQTARDAGIINSNPSCNCNIATDDATWGKVKALYE